jgi:hypothetical protein
MSIEPLGSHLNRRKAARRCPTSRWREWVEQVNSGSGDQTTEDEEVTTEGVQVFMLCECGSWQT